MNQTVKDILIQGGIFVPAQLIYGAGLPPGALHTWMWLRGLAGEKGLTPALSLEEIARLSGKSVSTLYGHLAILSSSGALAWQTTKEGLVVIYFGGRSGDNAAEDSKLQESKNALSLNQNDFNLIEDLRGERGEARYQNSGSPETQRPEADLGSGGENGVDIYRRLTHQRLHPTQREALEKLEDMDLWQETVAHWLMHGWNPGNVKGMLEVYERGGPSTCRFCGAGKGKGAHGAADGPSPIDELIAELAAQDAEIRKRLSEGPPKAREGSRDRREKQF